MRQPDSQICVGIRVTGHPGIPVQPKMRIVDPGKGDPTLVRFELAAKSASARLSRLRRALEGDDRLVGGSRIAPAAPRAGAG